MPKLSDYVRSAEEAQQQQQQQGGRSNSSSTRPAAEFSTPRMTLPPPPPASTTTTTTALNPLPRYRDRATGRLLPKGSPAPPRPRAHVQARREWRGLVRYCCAAVARAAGSAVPLPPDAGEEDEGGGSKSADNDDSDDLVPAFEDPEAPWGRHYAALLKGVRGEEAG